GESFCPAIRSPTYVKGRRCDVRFLSSTGLDIGEWEFSSQVTPIKAIGDRCRSARVNQSILKLGITNEQLEAIKVPFLQISGIYGQLLVEDLVNGFYIIFPGATFELPTKLSQIRKLKSTVRIFKHILEIYEKMLCEIDHNYNPLNDIFNVDFNDFNYEQSNCKTAFIREPFWSPKKNISSELIAAFEQMEKYN
ncbi:23175_t:CDS:2, partial [Racocetra persica]